MWIVWEIITNANNYIKSPPSRRSDKYISETICWFEYHTIFYLFFVFMVLFLNKKKKRKINLTKDKRFLSHHISKLYSHSKRPTCCFKYPSKKKIGREEKEEESRRLKIFRFWTFIFCFLFLFLYRYSNWNQNYFLLSGRRKREREKLVCVGKHVCLIN